MFAGSPLIWGALEGPSLSPLAAPLKSRVILYAVPVPLLLLSVLFTYLHYAENRNARDAARHWFAITPHRNRNAAAPGSSSSPRRGQAECTLPLRPSAPAAEELAAPSPPTVPSSPINVQVRLSHVSENGPGASLTPPATLPGTSRCASNGSCVTCELLIEGTKFKSMMSGKEYLFMTAVTCQVFIRVPNEDLFNCNQKFYLTPDAQRNISGHLPAVQETVRGQDGAGPQAATLRPQARDRAPVDAAGEALRRRVRVRQLVHAGNVLYEEK